ncbi:hypothetical protein [Bacillus massiliigorillae]|uniref:hypothetical protein n=1 Tax=Bacillus massiliigorillae TaxID=1243664 RepID=UPI0003A6B8D0|nr:hypothetical protein [Bacillus massiliigorillae]
MIYTKSKALFISMLTAIILFLWLSGSFSLWVDGMAAIANNTKKFTDENSHRNKGEYSVVIDLSNIESNIGKAIFNDGTHKIYISSLKSTGSMNTGGYSIGFRSSGAYSLNSASLISGIQHTINIDNSLSSNMIAKLSTEYKGKTYKGSAYGISGLNYKDGDEFYFFLFPNNLQEKNKISLSPKDKIKITLKDLYYNIWTKK